MNKTKQCKQCGIEKSLTSFWKAPRNKDGHFSKCSACMLNKKRVVQFALEQPSKHMQYQERGTIHYYSRSAF